MFSVGFLWVSMGFLWFLWGFYGSYGVSVGFYGFMVEERGGSLCGLEVALWQFLGLSIEFCKSFCGDLSVSIGLCRLLGIVAQSALLSFFLQ